MLNRYFHFFLVLLVLILILSIFIEADNENPGMKKMNDALFEMTQQNYDKALSIFLECFDNAHKFEPSFMDIKNSFLMIYLNRMLKEYPPTYKYLNLRYWKMINKIKSGMFLKYEVNSTFELSKLLNKREVLSDVYDCAIKSIKDRNKLGFVTEMFYSELYLKKRYRDIYENIDLIASAESLVKRFSDENAILKNYAKEAIFKILSEYSEILKSVNDIKGFRKIEKLFKLYGDGKSESHLKRRIVEMKEEYRELFLKNE